MADTIIVDTATRIFQDLCEADTVNGAEKGEWPAPLWDALAENGLPLAWISDEFGGAGAEIADGFAVLRVAGRFAAPVPVAETLIAGWLLAQARISAPAGPMTLAPVHADGHIELGGDGRLQGRARHVPFARNAGHLAVLCRRGSDRMVALVAAGTIPMIHGTSLAGEPRDEVSFDGALVQAAEPAPSGVDEAALSLLGAAARTQQMAGALERILDQSVQFALDRVQFGRPIAKFQAVQHNLATLAGEVAAAGAAADAAAEAIAAHGIAGDTVAGEVAIAKVRVGEAAGTGAAIAHQVHGAMGFTYEHSLHHATRRLWSWREEFGNETVWATRLGHLVAAQGADRLWHFITAGS
ncbi:MAG: acyl-CoA/acyl-ACP dehydrogenase [Alphaproteobacteria bacterium]|nr:acyl-CoA/acyl-ACP dehydrogenase [Alphaproteobacteria bacterium]MBV9861831.1 acyl-CoA/acyl-ACP dehydrogenase [Alphaproteobacteria bacterium]